MAQVPGVAEVGAGEVELQVSQSFFLSSNSLLEISDLSVRDWESWVSWSGQWTLNPLLDDWSSQLQVGWSCAQNNGSQKSNEQKNGNNSHG